MPSTNWSPNGSAEAPIKGTSQADHVFKHEPNAMECFLLIAFLAYNIFHAFWALSLKPQVKRGTTQSFWATLIAAELHGRAIPGFLSP